MSAGFVNGLMTAAHVANVNTTSPMDKLGYYPIVGSVTGPIRAIYGVAKAVFSAFLLIGSIIFTNNTHNWDHSANDGLLHVGRGVVEFFSFIGTGALLEAHDKERARINAHNAVVRGIYGW